jgi:hypothetical protein
VEVTNITRDKITVAFSPEELAFLSNLINEAPETVREWESEAQARETGETRTRMMALLAQLAAMRDEAKQI